MERFIITSFGCSPETTNLRVTPTIITGFFVRIIKSPIRKKYVEDLLSKN